MLKEPTNGLGVGVGQQPAGWLVVRCVLAGAGCAVFFRREWLRNSASQLGFSARESRDRHSIGSGLIPL
jgi:hypothetical protein